LVFLTPQILKEGAAPSSQRYLQMPAEDRPDARNTADTKPQS
jgi:hypothetical protein